MTEFEQILKELCELRRTVETLRSEFSIAQATHFENLPADAVVGADYVAYRFGCSRDSVIRGRFETDKIPRFRSKPIVFLKRNVDAIFKNLTISPSDRAAEIRFRAKNTQKKRKKKI